MGTGDKSAGPCRAWGTGRRQRGRRAGPSPVLSLLSPSLPGGAPCPPGPRPLPHSSAAGGRSGVLGGLEGGRAGLSSVAGARGCRVCGDLGAGLRGQRGVWPVDVLASERRLVWEAAAGRLRRCGSSTPAPARPWAVCVQAVSSGARAASWATVNQSSVSGSAEIGHSQKQAKLNCYKLKMEAV